MSIDNRRQSDIMIRIEKSPWSRDKPSLDIYYDGFVTAYPSWDSFFDDLKKKILERVKEVS